MQISEKEYISKLVKAIINRTADEQNDGEGQIVIYTGVWVWQDGSLHDEPEYV
jgi:hypothetical protein